MLFQPVLHTQTHARPLTFGTDSKVRGVEGILALSQQKESSKSHSREVWSCIIIIMMMMRMIEGVVCALPLCTCSAVHNCALGQMERMQGEGGTEPLEEPSPLTDKEKVMIQDSWAKVYQSCDDAGVAILVRYVCLLTCGRNLARKESVCLFVCWGSSSFFLKKCCFSVLLLELFLLLLLF